MEPEEFSRVLGQILGSYPYTMDERDRINEAAGEVDSIEEMSADIQALLSKPLTMQSRHLPGKRDQSKSSDPQESRASRLSTVKRTIVKDSIHCKECQANNDPNKVPVHPNCQCNVITDSIEAGVADPTHRLFNVLNPNTVDMITPDGVDIPTAIQLDPATTAILDPENARWADLMRWLEQMQPYLEQANLYVSIVVDQDTDEAMAEVEEVIDLLASDIEAGLEALKTGKFWFSIAKAAI